MKSYITEILNNQERTEGGISRVKTRWVMKGWQLDVSRDQNKPELRCRAYLDIKHTLCSFLLSCYYSRCLWAVRLCVAQSLLSREAVKLSDLLSDALLSAESYLYCWAKMSTSSQREFSSSLPNRFPPPTHVCTQTHTHNTMCHILLVWLILSAAPH